jgi:hypothetical protein
MRQPSCHASPIVSTVMANKTRTNGFESMALINGTRISTLRVSAGDDLATSGVMYVLYVAFGSDNWCDVCEHDVSGASRLTTPSVWVAGSWR